jgi:hypothetical protein
VNSNLNGQDGWVGGTSYSYLYVNPVNFYEGGKSLRASILNTPFVYNRLIATITSGTVYIAMQQSQIDQGALSEFILKDGSNEVCSVKLQNAIAAIANFDNNDWQNNEAIIKNGIRANQWYLFALYFDFNAKKFRCKMHDGKSWGNWTTLNMRKDVAVNKVDHISLRGSAAAYPILKTTDIFFDTITPKDPTKNSRTTGIINLLLID